MYSIFDREPTPNKFTISMGEKIKMAREESGLSQAELAKKIFRRRATISDIENGKSEVGTITLSRLASVLKKPLSYFFPDFATNEIDVQDNSPLFKELLLHYDLLFDENLKRVVVEQVKALSGYSPKESLVNLLEEAREEANIKANIKEYLDKNLKRKNIFQNDD